MNNDQKIEILTEIVYGLQEKLNEAVLIIDAIREIDYENKFLNN